MGFPVPLRYEFEAAVLRLLARRTRDANQGRRLLALAAVYDGGSRADGARIGSVGLQTVRDWVLRFNAAGPDGLVGKIDRGFAMLHRGKRDSHIDPPTSSNAIMQRAQSLLRREQ